MGWNYLFIPKLQCCSCWSLGTWLCTALYGLPKFLIEKLRRVQNFSAQLFHGSYKYDHIMPVLKSLHWLPVEQRIWYKIAVLGFKCVFGSAPSYLQKPQALHQPRHTRHSLHAGSGAGVCHVYTRRYETIQVETMDIDEKQPTYVINTKNNNRFYPHASLMNIVCYTHHASYTPRRFVSIVNNKFIERIHSLSTEPVTRISGIHVLRCENDQWN